MDLPLSVPGELTETLRGAQHLVVLTGSGISAESGIPTFRDAQTGLWEDFRPEELATPDAFVRNPERVWSWYRWRRELVSQAVPNAGHVALAELSDLLTRVTLVTQNVDGLHQQAGSREVLEFHGNLFDDRCFDNDCPQSGADGGQPVPRCAVCGGLLRPGVVWFGEAIPARALEVAANAISSCDMFVSIGTSAQVWPAAGFVEEARSHGAQTLEVNPNRTPMSDIFDYRLSAKAGAAVPALLSSLNR